MRDVAGALAIAATLLVLALPARLGGTPASFAIATALMAALNIALVPLFSSRRSHIVQRPASVVAAIAAGSIAAVLVALFARGWLHEILIYPHDPWRADMLVVVQEGIRRALHGQNPYAMYHIPWDATLPYGPMLWLPYLLPYVLHADVRFISMLGATFIPVACALAAAACAGTGRYASAVAALITLAALATSADLRNFASIAHTPSYWPGIALLAWLVARERWAAAATVCGLLIVARTTMVAVAPIVIVAVWYRNRPRAALALVLLTLAAALPYLPFAIRDFAALKYALYGSYQQLMKGFVWTSTSWVQNTVGITGLLLRGGLQAYAEIVQAIVMLAVYLLAWRSIRNGAPALPWMAAALFAFSATTLWPVSYVYFDVTLLWIAAALADTGWIESRSVVGSWCATMAAAAAVVLLVAVVTIPLNPAVDVGIGTSRAALYKGFSTDEGADSDRTFAWIDGTSAEILLPRRSRAAADVDLLIEPYLPTPASTQEISVALNGVVLGTTPLHAGWQTVTLHAPAQAWRIGINQLVLSLSAAASPLAAQAGDDTRRLSAAVDRLSVRTKM